MVLSEDLKDAVFVIPEDVLLSPILALPKAVRAAMKYRDTDYALTQRYARGGTKILSRDTGKLLEQFRTPRTLVEAIVAFSELEQTDPGPILESAGPLILDLVQSECLCPEGSEASRPLSPSLAVGQAFLDVTIVRCCQMIQDTEVYKVWLGGEKGEPLALKIVRPGEAAPYFVEMFEREAEALRVLDGHVAPRLRQTGLYDGRPYLLMEWLEGLSISQITDLYQKRGSSYEQSREVAYIHSEKMGLAARLIEAYAEIHERGCLHGDAHSGNVLVLEDGSVRILDFGYGRLISRAEHSSPRAGVPMYYDPELAAARLEGYVPDPVDERSEQYSVAVMAYELLGNEAICKGKYLPLASSVEAQMLQVVERPALPLTNYFDRFAPKIDATFLRALAKVPKDRFPSLRGFHSAFVHALEEESTSESMLATDFGQSLGSNAFRPAGAHIGRFVNWCAPGGSWYDVVFRRQPACSIKYGGAGVAYALFRLAARYGSADMLSLADLWITKTSAHIDAQNAFYGDEIEIDEAAVGRVCPLHTRSGVHAVQALISESMGDLNGCQNALSEFTAATKAPCDNIDLTLGRTGVLLACAILHGKLSGVEQLDLEGIKSLGESTLREIWAELALAGPIVGGKGYDNLGMAHGWAGLCYGALRWHSSVRTFPTPEVQQRIEEIVDLGQIYQKGVRWPYSLTNDDSASGWCNGHAGFVHLWVEAARMYNDIRYMDLAEGTAASVWKDQARIASICCGSAGQTYALMELGNALDDSRWIRRAERVGLRALDGTQTGYSLYKSLGGIAVMAADLGEPRTACHPMFGREI